MSHRSSRLHRSSRFLVSCAPNLLRQPVDGRLLIALLPAGSPGEPRAQLGEVFGAGVVLGVDADRFGASSGVTVDTATALDFPAGGASKLATGSWQAQAILVHNPDLRANDAPGTLYSVPRPLAPGGSATALILSQRVPDESLPADTATVRYIKFHSARLSAFWKRPIYLRAGIVLPENFGGETRRYGLRVRIGGFGTRYTAASSMTPHSDLVQVHLDGEGPLGDPYQIDSANHGPYGAAITTELIPEIERRFRCGGKASARFTDGGSTGGWVSLALQILYPDYFGGCWSGYPDPVDFRDYETVNLYADQNAYTDPKGVERPAMRSSRTRQPLYSIRHECRMENVLSRNNSYVTSGGQWGAWDAAFAPRGRDNRPVALWDPATGQVDHAAAAYARRYDLRAHLEANWKTIAPKLDGKMHLWVGDSDDYYLDAAVRRLDAFLKAAAPKIRAEIQYGPGRGHGWEPQPDRVRQDAMAATFKAGR